MQKKLFLFTLISTLAFNGFSQNICNKSLSQANFSAKTKNLSNVLSGKIKLQRATKIVTDYCVTTNQVVGFSKLFKSDSLRLIFAEAAYNSTNDKQNFYSVFDTFTHFSVAFKLYDFLQQKKSGQTAYDENFVLPNFPQFTYPKSDKYEGTSPCKNQITEVGFRKLVHQVVLQEDAAARLAIATNSSLKKCLTTAQAMKIATLLKSDDDKLTYLKTLWANIFDQKNYGAATQIFFDKKQQKEFTIWVQDKLGNSKNNDKNENCKITDNQYDTIKTTIKKINFITQKQSIAKSLIKQNKCFTSAQIKDIVALFQFDKNKLDIAKYAYDYCIDKENYYLIGDAFTFSAGKNELINFINQQKK